MVCLLLVLSALFQAPAPPADRYDDVSALVVGSPATVIELDLGKLKGEPRQLAWSPDKSSLYIQTADGNPPSLKLHHYVLTIAAAARPDAIQTIGAPPDWAASYWSIKSDRSAPGIPSLEIDVEQKIENMKYGTGSAGAAERSGGGNVNSAGNLEAAAQQMDNNVVRLTLLGETVSEFVNAQPIPGLLFGWGPEKSGTIAYIAADGGRLMLLDQHKHHQSVAGTKEALLPAWSLDGTQLAWLQKSGRRKYAVMSAAVGR